MQKKDSTPLNFGTQQFVLEQLKIYQENPNALSSDWVAFFQGMEVSGGASGGEDVTYAYRRYGHLLARTNPLKSPPASIPELDPKDPKLSSIYLGTTSYETDHIEDKGLREWFHDTIAKEEVIDQERMQRELLQARGLEEFLQKKFLGAKRFSLEGCESFIPMVWELLHCAKGAGYKKGVIGMAHRGRLNLLCNVLGKPYANMFQEFKGSSMPVQGLGDVKYHNGYRNRVLDMDVILLPNPSHLESVDPVMLGYVRAQTEKTFPLMVHGDASVAGQGVVYEMLQFSRLKGYATGGTVHIVINNQIGFTAEPEESRSTRYCTDIAKTFGFPIIHVNTDDPVACVRAARLAFKVRDQFATDVFIDLNGYRLYGHNEGDEPRFTNPQLYKKIGEVRTASQEGAAFQEVLEKAFQEGAKEEVPALEQEGVPTQVDPMAYLQKITEVPSGFQLHPKIAKLFEQRKGAKEIDWATGELLAYATLVGQKIPVRLSGQDSRRGTFSHRHAFVFDQGEEKQYSPLQSIGPFEAYNSPLSEYAVLGFEFGYSLGNPKALVIWEAQFGDFMNGAQIIIDQYLAGSETKWGVQSSLTLFLPHGYEGMGPEHTSCRLERFLELSASNNWRVIYPSTPAQLYHALRRQAFARKPLIVAMPKSMLRLPESYSPNLEGEFQPIIRDTRTGQKTLLCSGKIYYELIKARGDKPIAIHRIEELYPFPEFTCEGAVAWVQEEPENQGAWPYVRGILPPSVQYIGRKRIPIPDTGSSALYKQEQQAIIDEALRWT